MKEKLKTLKNYFSILDEYDECDEPIRKKKLERTLLFEKIKCKEVLESLDETICENFSHEECAKSFKKYSDNITSSRESAKKFLIDAGIHNEDGTLTDNYKNSK